MIVLKQIGMYVLITQSHTKWLNMAFRLLLFTKPLIIIICVMLDEYCLNENILLGVNIRYFQCIICILCIIFTQHLK